MWKQSFCTSAKVLTVNQGFAEQFWSTCIPIFSVIARLITRSIAKASGIINQLGTAPNSNLDTIICLGILENTAMTSSKKKKFMRKMSRLSPRENA